MIKEYVSDLSKFPFKELDRLNVNHENIRIDEFTSKRFIFFKDPDGLPIELYEK